MEMGTRENTLLHDHMIDGRGQAGGTAPGLSRIGASSTSTASSLLTSRSRDDVAEGGHMIVPSIGQRAEASDKTACSAANMRSGTAHMIPITWQKVKKSTCAA